MQRDICQCLSCPFWWVWLRNGLEPAGGCPGGRHLLQLLQKQQSGTAFTYLFLLSLTLKTALIAPCAHGKHVLKRKHHQDIRTFIAGATSLNWAFEPAAQQESASGWKCHLRFPKQFAFSWAGSTSDSSKRLWLGKSGAGAAAPRSLCPVQRLVLGQTQKPVCFSRGIEALLQGPQR